MEIAKEISSFVTQEFSTQRYKDFVSYVFSNGEGFEFLIEKFEEPEENFTYIKKEYCLLPEPLNHKLQFYVFEVDSVNAKIGLYKELKKRLETIDSSAVLACFYQEGNPTFRLSLITRSLNEDGGIDYSSKRQSFVLGNYNKTALLKFGELAKNTKDPLKTLEALTQAFSVENVTKEFYNKIVESFENFAQEIKFPIQQDETYIRQFILRMFSRILFCKFLEKKEIIPSKIWDREYIKTTNYYHDVLEPLFFQTLNTEKDCRDYGLIDTKIQELLRDIPYLNGGLFAPQEGDFFDLKNPTAHINDLVVPNSLFNDLFETLETFHFTIDESTSLDQEIGLDPEMLGMVFENLLSVLFTDNKVDKLSSLRKKTGSYYTPREIVSYMVKSSILEYLKTNTKLNEKELTELVFDYKNSFGDEEQKDIIQKLYAFKVLDPACGSGAFPMGMLQEICLILEALNHTDNLYDQKLSILQNNIYGVDIQPMAIEIARLRCFLSLICEEDKEHIAPLPNLEFKFISANSLISMPKNDNVLIYDAYNTIKEIMDQYFTSLDKRDLQKKYKEAQQIIAKEYQFSSLVEYDPFNPQSVAGFFDGELMFKIKEFDCVIGNPPYIRKQGLDKSNSKQYQKSFASATKNYDIYVLFVEQCLKMISKKGQIAFIMPHKWLNSDFGAGLRELTKNKIHTIISFGCFQIFEVSTYTALQWFRQESGEVKFVQAPQEINSAQEMSRFLTKLTPSDFLAFPTDSLTSSPWYFGGDLSQNIFSKVTSHTPLKEIFRIFVGLQTSKDSVYFLYDCQEGESTTKGYSQELECNVEIENALLKPLLMGDSFHRYDTPSTELRVLFPYYQGEDSKGNTKMYLYDESTLKERFPKGYAYLKKCEKVLRARENGRLKSDEQWWRYIYPKNQLLFGKEKLLCPDICDKMQFSWDRQGEFYFTTTIYGYIKSENFENLDYRFLLAVLNSGLTWWYLSQVSSVMRGGFYRNKPAYIQDFCIPNLSPKEQEPFIELVDKILKAKEQNPQANTSAQEREINNLVYTLYNLTDEEIQIIENKE